MRLTFRQTHLYRFVNMAEMERFELSRRFEPTYRISSLFNHYGFCGFFVSLSGCFVRPKP